MLTIIHTVADFDNSKINEIIKPAQSKECGYYCSFFQKELTENLALQNSEKEILQLLSIICSMWYVNGKKSPNAPDLTEFDLSFLESIIEKVSDDELKSRIADILWTKKPHHFVTPIKPFKYSNTAIESYLKIGRHFLELTSDTVSEVNKFLYRIKRAIQITISIKNQTQLQKIAEELKNFLEKTPQPFKNDYLIECLLNLLKLTGKDK